MTTRQELIEKLKNNRVPYKWLSDDEKELLCEMENRNVVTMDITGEWFDFSGLLYDFSILRIHKDYQEEENFSRDIKNINERLGRLEQREGKLSKKQVGDINEELVNIRFRLDELEDKLC